MLQSCGGPKLQGWGRTAEKAPAQHEHRQSTSPLFRASPWMTSCLAGWLPQSPMSHLHPPCRRIRGGGLFTLQLYLEKKTGMLTDGGGSHRKQQPRQSVPGTRGLWGPSVSPTTAGYQNHAHPYLCFTQGTSDYASIHFLIRPDLKELHHLNRTTA